MKKVYAYLVDADKRRLYWAESAEESDDVIHFVFLNGIECFGRVLQKSPNRLFATEYFGWLLKFSLERSNDGGCDMTMRCARVAEEDMAESIAGWVSLLMTMKAAVDYGVDLRNHDDQRTWHQGFVNN